MIHAGDTVIFVEHCDNVTTRFNRGDRLRVLKVYAPDEEWAGGLKVQRVTDDRIDMVWPEEVVL